MDALCLRVSVPVCSFRKGYAREYLETERVPPPATVYGFLLSLVGEEDRRTAIGTTLAIALTRRPAVSTVLRTVWRVKTKAPPGVDNNRRPDYQEVLTGLAFRVWVKHGPLADRLQGINAPGSITRFGGLSLGESRDLVDEVSPCVPDPKTTGLWLKRDPAGTHPLPLWVDHVGSRGTRREQFALVEAPLDTPGADDPRWVTIAPPGGG